MLVTKAIFEKEVIVFDPEVCAIEAIEIMDAEDFEVFSGNMTKNREFILDRINQMYIDSAARIHTLLVMDDEGGDGILIDASQPDDGVYMAFMPNIKSYIESQMAMLVNEIISDSIQNTQDSSTVISFGDIADQFDIPVKPNDGIAALLLRAFADKEEISGVEMKEDRFEIRYDLDFCHAENIQSSQTLQ